MCVVASVRRNVGGRGRKPLPPPTVWRHWFGWWPERAGQLWFWQHVGQLVRVKRVRKDDREGVVEACREVERFLVASNHRMRAAVGE